MGDADGKNDNEIASRPPPNGKILMVLSGFTTVLLKPIDFLILFLTFFYYYYQDREWKKGGHYSSYVVLEIMRCFIGCHCSKIRMCI